MRFVTCFLSALALSTLCVVPAAAQESEIPVDISLDYGAFMYDGQNSLLEVYIGVGLKSLDFEADSSGFTAEVPLRLTLTPIAVGAPEDTETELQPVVDRSIPLTISVQDTSTIQDGQAMVDQVREAVEPGEYRMDLRIASSDEQSSVRVSQDILVPQFRDDSPAASSVQLALDIQPDEGGNAENVKSGVIIRPNPAGLYGMAFDSVPHYVELYGIDSALSEEEYTLFSFISEAGSDVAIEGTEQRETREALPVDVLVRTVDVSALPSGIYYVNIVALNDANEAVVEQNKRLYVNNPDVERPEISAQDVSTLTSTYAVMSTEELGVNLAHADILANSQEQSTMGSLDSDDAKRSFLVSFWEDRDPNPATGVNEARRKFYSRLDYVRDNFREPGREPYETDRGRAYLKYGPPVDINRQQFGQNTVPYEAWTYENIPGEGRSEFVFADRFRSGQYDQIYSSVSGEPSLPNWESELYE